jgi:hypothetical protein
VADWRETVEGELFYQQILHAFYVRLARAAKARTQIKSNSKLLARTNGLYLRDSQGSGIESAACAVLRSMPPTIRAWPMASTPHPPFLFFFIFLFNIIFNILLEIKQASKHRKQASNMSGNQNFPKVNTIKSSQLLTSSTEVCKILTTFLQKEQTKVHAHQRQYWEDLCRISKTLATTDQQAEDLAALEQTFLLDDEPPVEVTEGLTSPVKVESETEAEATTTGTPTCSPLQSAKKESKEEKKAAKSAKKEAKEEKKAAKSAKKEAKEEKKKRKRHSIE